MKKNFVLVLIYFFYYIKHLNNTGFAWFSVENRKNSEYVLTKGKNLI